MTLQDCELCAYLEEVPYRTEYICDKKERIEWGMDAKCPYDGRSVFEIEQCPKESI